MIILKKYKKILTMAFLTMLLLCLSARRPLPFLESDAQAQVDAAGREAVSGNVLVWFLCAIAFLKVSQKIDSFMSSLGVNVGHTGGSMIAEAMIAARGVGAVRNFSRQHFGGGHSSTSSHVNAGSGSPGGFMAGGLCRGGQPAGHKQCHTHGHHPHGNKPAEWEIFRKRVWRHCIRRIRGHWWKYVCVFRCKGRRFCQQRNQHGGDGKHGVRRFHDRGKGSPGPPFLHGLCRPGGRGTAVPSFTGVEIGGGRITGTEISEEHPEGISFGMYHADQYTPPEGAYATVQAVDGTSWYKQYAQDAVEKSPYMAADGSIAYQESIVKKMPPAPKRKDRL